MIISSYPRLDTVQQSNNISTVYRNHLAWIEYELPGSYNDYVWRHVGWIFNPDGTGNIYMNGMLIQQLQGKGWGIPTQSRDRSIIRVRRRNTAQRSAISPGRSAISASIIVCSVLPTSPPCIPGRRLHHPPHHQPSLQPTQPTDGLTNITSSHLNCWPSHADADADDAIECFWSCWVASRR
jgi:hypothetical protein